MEVASADLSVGAPQHVELGIFSSDGQGVELLSFGQLSLGFSHLGDGRARRSRDRRPSHLHRCPGTPQDGPEPAFTDPNAARGIYQADVTFDQPGTWQVDATVDIPGVGARPSPPASSCRRSTPSPLRATRRWRPRT